jgi:Protein of Unknown function (DUF2784)
MLRLLDTAFFIFHTLVIAINVLGWIPRRTRRLHAIVLGITALSWFALGPLLGYQMGYCFCTDWHWQVRRQLGYVDTGSYIELLFRMTGLPISAAWANALAYGAFGAAVLGAIVVRLPPLWSKNR